jgi:hypothetical protein
MIDMDLKLLDRIIDVLDLELEVDLDDSEWEVIVDKKLTLLIDLRKIKKGLHEPN